MPKSRRSSFSNVLLIRSRVFDKEKALIIGDSLSSDMLGGQNAGIDTLWLNRKQQVADPKIKIDLEASSLEQISDILS